MVTVAVAFLIVMVAVIVAAKMVPSANQYCEEFRKELGIAHSQMSSFEKDWEAMTEGVTER